VQFLSYLRALRDFNEGNSDFLILISFGIYIFFSARKNISYIVI
jgi:hypothetical protein